jgi:hypothetical protein
VNVFSCNWIIFWTKAENEKTFSSKRSCPANNQWGRCIILLKGKYYYYYFKLSLPPQARSVAFFGWLLYIYDFCIMSRLLNFTLASLLMQSVRLEAAVSLLGSSFHFVRCTRSHISALIPPLPHRSYLVFLVNDDATLVTNLVLNPDKIEIYYWFDGFREFLFFFFNTSDRISVLKLKIK